jgi:hypothetical protein
MSGGICPRKCRKIAAPEFVIFLDQIVTAKGRGVPIRPTILQACSPVLRGDAYPEAGASIFASEFASNQPGR